MNDQVSLWSPVLAGVTQGSILRPIFFLIHIKDLSNNLLSIAKLLTGDTSTFSIVHNIVSSTKQITDDLKMISDWVYQWKVPFNSCVSKLAQKVIFSRKSFKVDHALVTFSNSPVAHTLYQKHLGLYLDQKLDFNNHIKVKARKACKDIFLIKKLHYFFLGTYF